MPGRLRSTAAGWGASVATATAALLGASAVTVAQAQGATTASASVETRLTLSSVRRPAGLDVDEWLAELIPGIRLQSRSGRVVGSLDYALTLQRRSESEPKDSSAHRLAANFSAEAVPRHFYVEGTASIAQQLDNAFGLQTAPGSSINNPNRQEVGSASISPVLRGLLLGSVNAEARVTASTQNTNNTLVGDFNALASSLALSSTIPGTLVSWNLSAREQETDFRVGRSTRTSSAVAGLSWIADADLTLSARAGSERQDVQTLDQARVSTWGVGANWRPSPRTRLQADLDDRYFGRSWRALTEYRLARSSFSFTSSRDTSDGAGARFGPLTLFQQFMALAESDIPDPVLREAVVRAQLAAIGADPDAIVRPGFVTSAVSVVTRNQLSAAWSGLRLSAGAQAYNGTTRQVDTLFGGAEPVRQSGYSVNVGWRLTPNSGLNATGSRQMTRATTAQPATDLKSASLAYTQALGLRTSLTASARYSVFNSRFDPYRESALTASLLHRF
jgi:uncharacterized protein (PEP-CTERM system associated)